jgi:hypothetical protein
LATIETYTLGSGAKRYRVRYRTPENRTTNNSGFTTKRDAQAFAATVEVSKMSGTYIAPAAGRITVADVARQWLSLNPWIDPVVDLEFRLGRVCWVGDVVGPPGGAGASTAVSW